MMMTSSSAQMLLLSTPHPPQALDPAPGPLWSHQVLNPGSPHFIVPQIILRNTHAHAHTNTALRPLSPRSSALSPAPSDSPCCCRLQQWHSTGMFAFLCVAHWKATNDLSSSAILTTADLHFRAQQVVPQRWEQGRIFKKAAQLFFFIRKLELRTATRIVNSGASPHTLGVM